MNPFNSKVKLKKLKILILFINKSIVVIYLFPESIKLRFQEFYAKIKMFKTKKPH